jgi:hypothetical protein
MRNRQSLQKIFWRNACPGGEKAVEVKPAQTNIFRQHSQVRLFSAALVQIADHKSDAIVIVHALFYHYCHYRSHPILAQTLRLRPLLDTPYGICDGFIMLRKAKTGEGARAIQEKSG